MIRRHAAAIVAALDSSANLVAYDVDDVPENPVTPYVVVNVSRRFSAVRRFDDSSDTEAWRAVTLYVGSTADEARHAEEYTEIALEGRRLVVEDYETTACRFEASRGIDRDPNVDDLYTGSTAWTYVSTKQAVAA